VARGRADPPPFVAGLLARLAPLGPVRARAMFGGHGFYLDDLMFGLVAGAAFYLKVDADTKPAFASAGSRPFTYGGKAKPIEMSYWLLPADGAADADAFVRWAELALAAARRARARARRTRR
jgi:DNA transformation protein